MPVDLRQGAHRTLDYLGHNHQGLVPTLEVDGLQLTQSLAIIEWLDETYPAPPLLPADACGARPGALAGPAPGLRDPAAYQPSRPAISAGTGWAWTQREVDAWYRHWIAEGFGSLERRLAERGRASTASATR